MKKAILYTCLAIFLVQLDATILFISFSAIADSFQGVSTQNLSWVLNVYTLAFGALLIPAGGAGDRFGRKKIFLYGVAGFTLASLLCGLSRSAEQLIAFRLLQAIGAALLVPTSLALLLEETPKEKRAVAVSLWGAMGALGAAVGPALGGLFISTLGWHWVFFINVPVGVFIVFMAKRRLAESVPHGTKQIPSMLAVFLVISSMVCLSYALLAEGRGAVDPGAQVSFVVAGLFLLVLFIAHCRFSKRPLLELSLFRDRTFSIANLSTFFYSLAFSVIFFGTVQSLVHQWHFSVATAGLLLIPGPLFVIPSAILSGRHAKMHGHRGLICAGSLLVAAGLGLQMIPYTSVPSVFLSWMPGWILVGIGNGMVLPSLAGAAVFNLPHVQYAIGSGVNNSIRQFGGLLGIAVAVTFIGSGSLATPDQFSSMFSRAALIAFLVAALSFGINTHPLRRTE